MEAHELEQVLRLMGLDNVKRREGYVGYSCPFVSRHTKKTGDRRPSGWAKVAEGRSYWKCYTCHSGGESMIRFLNYAEEEMGKSFPHVRKLIEDYEDLPLSLRLSKVIREAQLATKKVTRIDYDVWDETEVGPFERKQVHEYLESRGVDQETWEKWGLGHDKVEDRIVFPVRRNGDAALLGIYGRHAYNLKDDPGKHKNYWAFEKSKVLYGEHLIKVDDKRIPSMIVVEGNIDTVTWSGYKLGYGPVVGVMGSEATSDQREKIASWVDTVYLAFDGDLPGQFGAEKTAKLLHGKCRVFLVKLPRYSDPANMSREEAMEVLDKSRLYVKP